MRKLRAAVIGGGVMGLNHLRVYSDMEDVDLVALADVNETLNKKIEKKYRIKTYTDYKEMLKHEQIDIVTVAVPTVLHHEVATAVLKHKIHLLLEKPIASSIEEADSIIKLARQNDVKLLIGHIERFNPAIQELKRLILRGDLGRIYKIDANRVSPIPVRIHDVGVTIDIGVHDIDVVRFLTESEPERIYAETAQRVHSKKEDLLAGIIKFSDGTICYLNVNWLTPTKIRKLYITGEKGMYVVDYIEQELLFFENAHDAQQTDIHLITEGKMIKYKIEKKEPLRNEIDHFVQCVLKDEEPLVSGEDGKAALRIATKLLLSAENNQVINYEEEQ
jgi:UDP-N-acetylglucosamine 3-dehydrogenase